MCLGVPGRLVRRWQDERGLYAAADFVGEERVIRLDYLPDLVVGDWTIVHAGFALTRMEEAEAHKTIALMRSVGLLDDAVQEVPT
ncbi:MAG: HypC/HybG/HupF family hydrogenase formation chaperone [Phycicoccus sp.]|nr:HypC/HybG/HupF family hydrogenase formation chaperone [Phycicoccus sp.]